LGIFLGLAAAVCWGAADFLARYSARRIGAFRTLLFMQLTGFLAASVCLAAAGRHPASLESALTSHWRLALFLGTASGFSMLAFYGALEKGALSVVAPISSCYPALTLLLAWATGERLAGARMAGVAFALTGVILTAITDSPRGAALPLDSRAGVLAPGVWLAIAAALGFGVTYWGLGFFAVPVWGGLSTVWIQRFSTVVLLGASVFPMRVRLAPIAGSALSLVAAVGVLDALGFLVSNWGFEREQVGVVTVLGSLFSAVTLLLAYVVLRERLSRRQWLGVALIFAGILLINSPTR
jgi:drug/metabolite transporter (DMT)-like permease